MAKLEKLYTGCYRMTENHSLYMGHIKKDRKTGKWHASIKEKSTGATTRYAGIWNTRKGAIEEIEYILARR